MQMKRRNLMFLPLAGLLALAGMSACGVDRWEEYYPLTGRDLWIDSVMRAEYLWYDEIPAFEELNYFLAPQSFLEKVRSQKDKGFSTVDTLDPVPPTGYGFDYTLNRVPDNDTAYYALITYVIPDSPAAEAGLKRGESILTVDNDYITKKSEQLLKEGESRQLLAGRYVTEKDEEGNATKVFRDSRETTLPAARPVTDDVIPAYGIPAEYVGYLVYNSFAPESNERLRELSRYYRQQGVRDFVLDLRYNAGGDMECVQLLAGILAPADKLGTTLASLRYSDKQSGRDSELMLDAELLVGGSNLNLSTLYVLTGSATAGASEMLVNCLRPYMTVILIGEKTAGQYVATAPFVNQQFNWILRPVVCEVLNANGKADYTSGFTPDYSNTGLSNPDQILPLGDPQEALLSIALGLIKGEEGESGTSTKLQSMENSIRRVPRTFRKGLMR